MSWHKVAKVNDFSDRTAQLVPIEGKEIALFKQAGQFYAMDAKCCHRGGPLVEGELEGMIVTCPWHAWSFDIQNGNCQNAPGAKQKVYAVKVEGSDVLIEV